MTFFRGVSLLAVFSLLLCLGSVGYGAWAVTSTPPSFSRLAFAGVLGLVAIALAVLAVLDHLDN